MPITINDCKCCGKIPYVGIVLSDDSFVIGCSDYAHDAKFIEHDENFFTALEKWNAANPRREDADND